MVNCCCQGEKKRRKDILARRLRMEANELHSIGRAMAYGAGSGCTLPCFPVLLAALPCVPDQWFMAHLAFILMLDEYRLVRVAYADLTLVVECGVFETVRGVLFLRNLNRYVRPGGSP